MCCRVNQLMSSPVSNSWAREYMSQHDYSFYKDKTNCLTAQSPKIVILLHAFYLLLDALAVHVSLPRACFW